MLVKGLNDPTQLRCKCAIILSQLSVVGRLCHHRDALSEELFEIGWMLNLIESGCAVCGDDRASIPNAGVPVGRYGLVQQRRHRPIEIWLPPMPVSGCLEFRSAESHFRPCARLAHAYRVREGFEPSFRRMLRRP
jgi:hypothetical protein